MLPIGTEFGYTRPPGHRIGLLETSASHPRASPVRADGWAVLTAATSCCPATRAPLRAGRGARRLESRIRKTRRLADLGPRLRELEVIPDLVQTYA